MKNLIFILCLLTISSSCQKSDVKDEPSGVFVGTAIIKTNVIKNNNEIVNFSSVEDVEIDFDNKIMKSSVICKNSIQIADNKSIIFGIGINNCLNNADCGCFFSNDSANYIINNDVINISFNIIKRERQHNFTEKDTVTILRSMELKRK